MVALPLYLINERDNIPEKVTVIQHVPIPVDCTNVDVTFFDTDDELSIENNTVFWRGANGTIVRKKFTYPSNPLDAIFAEFSLNYSRSHVEETGASHRNKTFLRICLCVLSAADNVFIYTPGGSVFELSLPFRARKLWKLHRGILFERHKSPFNPYQQPLLFSLLHPLDEVKPISVYPKCEPSPSISPSFNLEDLEEDSDEPNMSDFFCDPKESICFISTSPPFMVSFISNTLTFSLWNIQKIKESSFFDEKEQTTVPNEDFTSEEHPIQLQSANELSFSNDGDSSFRPIMSEILLARVWSSEKIEQQDDQGEESQKKTVFLAATWNEHPLLCVYSNSCLYLLTLTVEDNRITQVTLDAKLSCKAVVPIHRFQEKQCNWLRDFIILTLDNKLLMYRGNLYMCEWTLENNQSIIRSIEHGVSERFSIFVEKKVYRVSARLTPASPLLFYALDAIDANLQPSLAISLRMDTFMLISQERLKGSLVEDLEWHCFLLLLSYLIVPVSPSNVQKSFEKNLSPWEQLLSSEYHREFSQENKRLFKAFPLETKSFSQSFSDFYLSPMNFETSREHFISILHQLFFTLHLLYEDYKLSNLKNYLLKQLVPLLMALAIVLKEDQYVDHYKKDFGEIILPNCLQRITSCIGFTISSKSLPSIFPDIYSYLMRLMQSKKEVNSSITSFWPTIKEHRLCPSRKPICYRVDLIIRLYKVLFIQGKQNQMSTDDLVLEMVKEGFNTSVLQDLPFGVAICFRQLLYSCRSKCPNQWPLDAFALIERQDLISMKYMIDQQVIGSQPLDPIYTEILRSNDVARANANPSIESNNPDGLQLIQDISKLRFGKDHRMKEVCKLLRSSEPLYLKLERRPELSDHDYIQEQQMQLLLLCKRSMALPCGRGMLTMRSLQPRITEQLKIPPLSLSAYSSSSNAVITLNTGLCSSDLSVWPEFHNGVASGLRLASGVDKITRNWIVYNKPEEPENSHAGVLLALGLQGYLPSLAMTDVYAYLSPVHNVTSVAVLLGMACAKRGSMDRAVLKMLYLHLPSFLPAVFSDIEVSSISQTAALIGIGLLHQGTGHRLMTEQLLVEIGKIPSTETFQDRESYSLSAGLALGMVLLGKGSDGCLGLQDLEIEDRLHRYMVGGRKADPNAEQGPTELNKCAHLREGSNINIGLTAPGATLALGLMFLKSNNAAIAFRLEIPDTVFLLDYVRPDLLMLRVLSRSLVLWDSILPTKEWIEAQIPSIVKNIFDKLGRNLPNEEEMIDHIDTKTICQVHANILAGACLSIGLRFAGTSNLHAQSVLFKYLDHFRYLRGDISSSSTILTLTAIQKPDRSTVEMCLAVVAQSVALVMAGSGDINTFRILREIRRRKDPEVSYGNYMAIHMAIGFLFLGGGFQTLKRSNEAIAALVIALYPRYPSVTTDNQYHLQALRHLYVLAVESRCIETIDVDTQEPCSVPVEFLFLDTKRKMLKRITPCLTPDLNEVAFIRVCSPRYHLIHFDLSQNPDIRRTIEQERKIFVKRRIGHLSYWNDPHGVRSLVSRVFPKGDGSPQKHISEFIHSFTEDPNILAFCHYFCSMEIPFHKVCDRIIDDDLSSFSMSVLYECLIGEKPDMLIFYLMIYQSIHQILYAFNSFHLGNLKMIFHYYEQQYPFKGQQKQVLQQEFLASIRFRLDEFFKSLGNTKELLSDYIHNGKYPQVNEKTNTRRKDILFACLLRYLAIPYHKDSLLITGADVGTLKKWNEEKGIPISTLIYLQSLFLIS